MLTLAKWTQSSIPSLAASSGRPKLVTIPYSHYVDFARMCLNLGNGTQSSFDEIAYAPGQHVLPVLNLRLCDATGVHLSSTSAPGANSGKERGHPTGVPALVMPDGTVHVDSWKIANDASGLAPLLDGEAKTFYDTRLGPDTRQLAYAHLLDPKNEHIFFNMCKDPMFGASWCWMWSLGVGAVFLPMLRKSFKTTDMAEVEECKTRVLEHFNQWMSKRVMNKKGKYLNGDTITVEDVAFCALGAPAVCPDKYCGGAFKSYFDELIAINEEARALMEQTRNTPAGKYIMEFYAEHAKLGL